MPIRVLHILLEPRMGGPQLRILAVASSLREKGIETVVALPEGPAPFAQYLQDQGFTVYRTPLSRLRSARELRIQADVLRRIPPGLLSLVRIVKASAADIVHVHGLYQAPSALVGWLTDRPLVWHLNDLLLPKALVRGVAPGILRLVQAALPVSNAVRRYLFEGLDERGKVCTVYDPPVRVDPNTLSADAAKAEGSKAEGSKAEGSKAEGSKAVPRSPGESYQLLNVANLYKIKGQAELVEAMSLLSVPASLTIAGAPLDTQLEVSEGLVELRERLRLTDRVHFSGWQEDVARLYRDCDVYVHPSHSEACPLAVLEAMAAGRPVVATAVGGVPELVVAEETGLLVPPQAPRALAAAIERMCRDDGFRARAGEAGRQRVLAHFSLARCADRHEQVYRAVLAGKAVGDLSGP